MFTHAPLLDLGSGPTLLFLHGIGMRAAAYRPLLDLLSRHARVIAPDLPGAGWAPLPDGPLTLDRFADAVQAMLDARGIRPAAIVGHSLGGGVALSLAARGTPPRSLILIDSVGPGVQTSPANLLARFFLLKTLRVILTPSRWPAVWRVLPHFLATTAFRFRKMVRLGGFAIRAARERHPALSGSIPPPVFVTAVDDELFPPALYGDCAAGLRGSRVVEVAGGHDWCLLRPVLAARVVLAAWREAESGEEVLQGTSGMGPKHA